MIVGPLMLGWYMEKAVCADCALWKLWDKEKKKPRREGRVGGVRAGLSP